MKSSYRIHLYTHKAWRIQLILVFNYVCAGKTKVFQKTPFLPPSSWPTRTCIVCKIADCSYYTRLCSCRVGTSRTHFPHCGCAVKVTRRLLLSSNCSSDFYSQGRRHWADKRSLIILVMILRLTGSGLQICYQNNSCVFFTQTK